MSKNNRAITGDELIHDITVSTKSDRLVYVQTPSGKWLAVVGVLVVRDVRYDITQLILETEQAKISGEVT